MKNLVCASFFAGVGGIDLGFKQAGFNTVYANELDPDACKTFNANHNIKADNRSITDVKADEIPDFDIMLAGFPCQPFSIAGRREGFDDQKGRGVLFNDLERIFIAKKPKVIFLENVKNLVSHDDYRTFKVILDKLYDAGYHVKSVVLNATEYGNLPQNRERIYIVAFQDEFAWSMFDFPMPENRTCEIQDIVDFEGKVPEKYYYREGNKNYGLLSAEVISSNTVYELRRHYIRENKSGVCPTLTASMGTGGNNVPIILSKTGIRKLTPRECFLVQGFPSDFVLPSEVSNSSLYKQSGNSVAVSVIARIANEIMEVI